MEVERQDPRCQALVKAPSLAGSLARTMPKNVHITQVLTLPEGIEKIQHTVFAEFQGRQQSLQMITDVFQTSIVCRISMMLIGVMSR